MEPFLEKDKEERVRVYARDKYGVLSRKMNGRGFRAWCDRLFLGPGGKVLWIEFKRQGAAPTKLQERHHQQLREMGFDVRVVDNVEDGKKAIDEVFS